MKLVSHRALLGLTGSTLVLLSSTAFAQQSAEALPWQKEKPPQADPDVKELLPWLLGEGGKKKAQSGAVWSASVDPKAPKEPAVPDPGMAPGALIETGTVAPSGLVLKSAVPGGPNPVVKAAAEGEAAKIKRSVPLPGDRPVEQSDVHEVPADQSGAPAAARQAEDTAPVAPDNAAAIPPAQVQMPSERPAPVAEAPAAASPATEPAVPGAIAPPATAAAAELPPAEHLPAPASPVRPAVPRANAVNSTPAFIDPSMQRIEHATPVADKEHSLAQAAPGAVAPAAPEAARAVESVPALPVAEEAAPIPDPLPDALVTPVPRQDTVKATEAAPGSQKADQGAEAETRLPHVKPPVPKSLAENANVAQQYCFNIADAAKDARYAWQKKTLADIELELNKRIALLDARTAEYQKWLARRDEFIRNAEENVVKIMSGMRPDAAAVQLALMNEEAAAAVIAKLNTRNASAVLNEMEPSKAAKLTMIITGATKLKRKRELQQNMTPAQGQSGASPAPAAGPRAADATQPQGGRS